MNVTQQLNGEFNVKINESESFIYQIKYYTNFATRNGLDIKFYINANNDMYIESDLIKNLNVDLGGHVTTILRSNIYTLFNLNNLNNITYYVLLEDANTKRIEYYRFFKKAHIKNSITQNIAQYYMNNTFISVTSDGTNTNIKLQSESDIDKYYEINDKPVKILINYSTPFLGPFQITQEEPSRKLKLYTRISTEILNTINTDYTNKYNKIGYVGVVVPFILGDIEYICKTDQNNCIIIKVSEAIYEKIAYGFLSFAFRTSFIHFIEFFMLDPSKISCINMIPYRTENITFMYLPLNRNEITIVPGCIRMTNILSIQNDAYLHEIAHMWMGNDIFSLSVSHKYENGLFASEYISDNAGHWGFSNANGQLGGYSETNVEYISSPSKTLCPLINDNVINFYEKYITFLDEHHILNSNNKIINISISKLNENQFINHIFEYIHIFDYIKQYSISNDDDYIKYFVLNNKITSILDISTIKSNLQLFIFINKA